jgi:hypothetical protein
LVLVRDLPRGAGTDGPSAQGLDVSSVARVTARTFGDFFETYRRDREIEMAKFKVTCIDFKCIGRNTLCGFATIRVAELRLTIKDVAVHEKGDARWAQLPARPQIDKDGTAIRDKTTGKVAYSSLMEFDDRITRDAFSAAVVAAVLERDPKVFEDVH